MDSDSQTDTRAVKPTALCLQRLISGGGIKTHRLQLYIYLCLFI